MRKYLTIRIYFGWIKSSESTAWRTFRLVMKKKKIIAFENTSTAMTYLISILDKTKQKLKVVHLLNSNIEVSETMLRLCWLVIALGFQQRYNHNCSIRYHRTKLFLVICDFFLLLFNPKKGNKNLFFLLVWTLLTAKKPERSERK
jgi:hypothetical protein